MNIIFGPIQSRRFGQSLGVDLSPCLKQCNYDCLYCELEGKKAQEQMQEILSVHEILQAIKEALDRFEGIASLTITANGEPTLYPHLYELILALQGIKGEIETLLLTNGSLLWNQKVIQACLLFDKVKFSLDAVSEKIFRRIDRPQKKVNLAQILQGIVEFAHAFRGELYAEILFLKNINDHLEEVHKMAEFLAPLPLKRLDIGSLDRPPAYRVESVEQKELEAFGSVFLSYGIPVCIAKRGEVLEGNAHLSKEEILKTLALRPMSLDDAIHLWSEPTQALLEDLTKEGLVIKKQLNNIVFYCLFESPKP